MSEAIIPNLSLTAPQQASLCDLLERVLDKGVMAAGELTLSVADIDLIYLGFCIRLSGISSIPSSLPEESS